MKDSFVLYNSFYEPIKSLNNEQLGKLLRAIFNYTITGEITHDNEIIIAFMFIKNQIDIDSKKWEEKTKKRSEAGKRGMSSRWNNKNNNVITNDNKNNNVINTITNITDNDNVNENENDNVNDNVYKYYENIYSRTLNAIEYETMTKWLENKSEEEIKSAIDETAKANIDNIKYVEKILFSNRKKARTIPEWFNKEIINEEAQEEDTDFKEFINEFRK